MYGLPENYQARLQPQYFNDILQDAHLWQADVYRLATEFGRSRIVDIGCGRGSKLLPLAHNFRVVGLDYGDNIRFLKSVAPHQEWYESDLEQEVIPKEIFENSVVICADVIEHLKNPSALIATLKNACQTAAYVLLSTPDRERLYNGAHNGPPSNLAHTREWTLKELVQWLSDEGLPIVWGGWTISYDNQPERLNTSLVILSHNPERLKMPISFQPGLTWASPSTENRDLLKVWMTPTPREASRDITNSINQIVVRVNQYLPEFGVQLVEEPDQAIVHVGHAGQGSQSPLHVAHYHGLYNTAQGSQNFAINREVIRNLKTALIVTAPSQWIADVIRRDMHLSPRVIGWGVDVEEWTPKDHAQYVIWNKARVDNIANPQPMLELAARAHDTLFLTTFGEGTPNVKTIGRQPYEKMKNYVRNAAIYLSTNVETFGIGLMEAMAAGVPVLSFKQGAQVDYIVHGYNGFLAEPGDMEGLYQGLLYCLKYRKQLGINARETAKGYTWRKVAQEFAKVYFEVVEMQKDIRPHRIDPSLYQV